MTARLITPQTPPASAGRPYHKLLQRQLRRIFGAIDAVPGSLSPLLAMVSEAYEQADHDRAQVARSLETMSEEVFEKNTELRRQLDEQRATQRELEESEARFQAFMSNTPILAALKRPTGEVVYANRPYEAMLGVTIGKRVEAFLHPRVAEIMLAQDAEVLATGKTVAVEGTLHPDGEDPSAYLVYKFPVPGATDADLLIGVAALDITKRRQAEQALERSRASLAEAHEVARLGSWEFFVHSSTAHWSAELYRIYGAPPTDEPLTWDALAHIIPAQDIALLRDTFARTVATRAPFAFDHRSTTADGSERVVHLRGRAVENDVGEVVRLVGTAQDITERKQLEERISQGQRLEAVGQLAAGIAHEINTPVQYVGDNIRFVQDALTNLLSVVGRLKAWRDGLQDGRLAPSDLASEMTAMLENDDLDYYSTELPVSVAHALDGTSKIAEIVRAVKAVAHPGNETRMVIDLNSVIETAIAVSRSEWKFIAQVETDLEPSLPPMVCLAGEMHQVFLNLIVNAAQAIAEAQERDGDARRQGRITVCTRLKDDAILVRVSDNGAGIPDAIRARVFDAFFTTKAVGKGTGHGLALAHRVITNHKGRIAVESEASRGTTLSILLPLGDDDLSN